MKIPFAGHMKRAHLMLTVLSRMETQLATYFMRKTDVKSVIAYYMLKWLLWELRNYFYWRTYLSFAYSCLQIDFEWIATLQKYSLLQSNSLLRSTYQLVRHLFFSLEIWCCSSAVKPSLKLIFYKKGGIIVSLFITNRLVWATGTNWSIGSSIWTWGRTSLWGCRSTGKGCPGKLWSLLLWRYSRFAWTRSCAACSRWPCFGRGVGLGDPQRSLPTPNILWFCDSVMSTRRTVNNILLCYFPRNINDSETQLSKNSSTSIIIVNMWKSKWKLMWSHCALPSIVAHYKRSNQKAERDFCAKADESWLFWDSLLRSESPSA